MSTYITPHITKQHRSEISACKTQQNAHNHHVVKNKRSGEKGTVGIIDSGWCDHSHSTRLFKAEIIRYARHSRNSQLCD